MDIDFVVLWVDGSDPEWQAEKAKYQGKTVDDSNSANRFRDWGLMPYWFRAVEKFCPWVRKVHFVTCGHVPAWLNLDHPKLNHVRHSDYIPAEYLPTFNSHTIEMNLHRIPDLAEHFVYFNDDMFLLQPMDKEKFFCNGLPCTYGREEPWVFQHPVGVWSHAAANDLGVINKYFSKKKTIRQHRNKFYCQNYRWKDNLRTWVLSTLFPERFSGFCNLHAPAAYLKETFETVWRLEPELLQKTSADRFRSAENVNQWLCLWWQIASGKFSPYMIDNVVEDITDESISMLCKTISGQTHSMICLNDSLDTGNMEELSGQIKWAFEQILPEKCGFEK